jgi:hypothetical protein
MNRKYILGGIIAAAVLAGGGTGIDAALSGNGGQSGIGYLASVRCGRFGAAGSSENIGAAFGDAFLVGGGRFGRSRRGLESDCRDRFVPIPSAPFATTDSIEGIEIFIHPQ